MQHVRALPIPSLGLGKSLAIALTLGPLLWTLFPPRRPKPILPPLPNGVKRIFIKSGDGKGQLEVLVADPPSPEGSASKAPLLFIHGGYGSAWCWSKWITYFSNQQGRVVYSMSLSGHGLSTRPLFFHLRPTSYFAKDVLSTLSHISKQNHTLPPVVVAHSAGGGLAQYVIDQYGSHLRTGNEISGLVGIGPFPPNDGLLVYKNWMRMDPSLIFRMQISNGYTVLNTPSRVSRAFFGVEHAHSLYGDASTKHLPDTLPDRFFEQMNKEENIVWPIQMGFPFANAGNVIKNLTFNSNTSTGNEKIRIALLAGSHDVLMSPPIMRLIQHAYNCELEFISGSGHHLMQDDQWELGAIAVEKQIARWKI